MADKNDSERAATVVEAEGEQGILTRLVLMGTPEPEDVERPDQANVEWVFKQMTPKRNKGAKKPPSIGSMQIPGKA